jgi:hypothetical protein
VKSAAGIDHRAQQQQPNLRQITTQAAFSNAVSLLNSQTGDRYLFRRTTDTAATVSADVMLDSVERRPG